MIRLAADRFAGMSGMFDGSVSYSYSGSVAGSGDATGGPLLRNGDVIVARISGANPGGTVRMQIWQRPGVGTDSTVVGQVDASGNFTYAYTVNLPDDARRMWVLQLSVDYVDIGNNVFMFSLGDFSQQQAASSPFLHAAYDLPTDSPYYMNPNAAYTPSLTADQARVAVMPGGLLTTGAPASTATGATPVQVAGGAPASTEGLTLASVPWWVWVGAAGVAFWAFGGSK